VCSVELLEKMKILIVLRFLLVISFQCLRNAIESLAAGKVFGFGYCSILFYSIISVQLIRVKRFVRPRHVRTRTFM
jgi:hypothetical protein